jgi:hypothetical protein
MTVTYVGGDTVSIKLRKIRGLGFLMSGVASVVVGDHTSLFDPEVLGDEIFTVNRAGFDYFSRS